MEIFGKKRITSEVLWTASLVFLVACLIFAGLLIFHFHVTPHSQMAQLDPATREVVIQQKYCDGYTRELSRYSASTDGVNPLLSSLYSGDAPIATSYDPNAIYATDALFSSFEYNCGWRYGDCGTFSREQVNNIMTIKFNNRVVSWVDSDGVIASALQVDKDEWCVAIY